MNHLIDTYVRYLATEGIQMKIERKKDSKLMHFIAKLLFFLPNFMDGYSTTIGNTVYLKDRTWNARNPFITLAHEAQHIRDNKRMGNVLYVFLYLSPQILALLSLLALSAIWLSNYNLLFLLNLLWLLPIPSPGRTYVETRGYMVGLVVRAWTYGYISAMDNISRSAEHFMNNEYYWMWPLDKERVEGRFRHDLPILVKNPEKFDSPVLRCTFEFLRDNNLLEEPYGD